jgi:hypothetical protein
MRWAVEKKWQLPAVGEVRSRLVLINATDHINEIIPDVAARAEGAPRTCQQNRVYVAVGAKIKPYIFEFMVKPAVNRVERVGAVQCYSGDSLGDFNFQMRVSL